MTEQELRNRLNSLTEAIPDETHRSFLMAASPGKDEIIMKKKISVGLIIAILVSLAAIAFAATEYVQKFISVNWQGETAADQNAAIDVPDPLSNPMNRMRKILNSTPDDVLPIIEWNGTPPRSSRVRHRKTDSLEGIDYNTCIVLPDNIAEKKNPLSIDSHKPTESYRDFIMGEVRYSSLMRANPERAEKLVTKSEAEAKERFDKLSRLVDFYKPAE